MRDSPWFRFANGSMLPAGGTLLSLYGLLHWLSLASPLPESRTRPAPSRPFTPVFYTQVEWRGQTGVMYCTYLSTHCSALSAPRDTLGQAPDTRSPHSLRSLAPHLSHYTLSPLSLPWHSRSLTRQNTTRTLFRNAFVAEPSLLSRDFSCNYVRF